MSTVVKDLTDEECDIVEDLLMFIVTHYKEAVKTTISPHFVRKVYRLYTNHNYDLMCNLYGKLFVIALLAYCEDIENYEECATISAFLNTKK